MSQTAITELFNVKTLQFEGGLINIEQIPLPNTFSDAKFGVLNLKANLMQLTQAEIEFVLQIDSSGSMSERCSDGRTKAEHIAHVLKNIIWYFKENSVNAFITIRAFDNKIYKIVDHTNITDENIDSIILSIDKIRPREETNIEIALNDVKEIVTNIKSLYPHRIIYHLFMTDGCVNQGIVKHNILSTLVDNTIKNIFFGFGIEHDNKLLNTISEGENSAYYFIDKLESSGQVYGEVLHEALYPALKNVEITIANGLIYDFKQNMWVESILIGEIMSEADKSYHIASMTPNECIISLVGKKASDLTDYQLSIVREESDVDLTRFLYRQMTLQHLYIANEFVESKYQNLEKKSIIKDKLANFIDEMKKYMEDNNLNDDSFMKNLCDDIYISYTTFDTKFASMYIKARQSSQGEQRCNNVTINSEEYSGLQRQFGRQNGNGFDYDVALLPPACRLQHELSACDDTPYHTPGATQMMRAISSQPNEPCELDTVPIPLLPTRMRRQNSV